jgi:hypothetical protein
VLVIVIGSVGCTCLSLLPYPPGDPICLEAPYSPPPPTFQDSGLVGTWETEYGRSIDRLTLGADHTFQQLYEDRYAPEYVYHSPPGNWWVERLQDGQVRLHLEGARYYLDGIKIAEREGLESYGEPDPPPMPFFDPIAEELVFMVGKLVLNVRVDSSGELLLHHLWMYHDEGFAMTGCERDIFRRVETP